jgi:hypothetical protein
MHKQVLRNIGDLITLLQSLDPETRVDHVEVCDHRPEVYRSGVFGHIAEYVEFSPRTYTLTLIIAEPEKFERDLRNGMERLHE